MTTTSCANDKRAQATSQFTIWPEYARGEIGKDEYFVAKTKHHRPHLQPHVVVSRRYHQINDTNLDNSVERINAIKTITCIVRRITKAAVIIARIYFERSL